MTDHTAFDFERQSNFSGNNEISISTQEGMKINASCEEKKYDFHNLNNTNIETECLAYLTDHGFPISKIVADGKFHRLSIDGGRDEDEWYVAHQGVSDRGNRWLMCSFGTWAGGLQTLGTYKSWESKNNFSFEEKKYLEKEFQTSQRELEKRRREEEKEKISKAKKIWGEANVSPTDPDHSIYLNNKQVSEVVCGIRFSRAYINDGCAEQPCWNEYPTLVVPLRNIEDQLQAIQHIFPDGRKRIYGVKRGAFFVIGDIKDDSLIWVAEGLATALTVHLATNDIVIVAFDCYNLESVLGALRKKHPNHEIIIAADNDIETEGNPGKTHAETAAKKFKSSVCFPAFSEDFFLPSGKRGTDWNDLASHCGGLEVVRKQLRDYEQNHLQTKWEKLTPFGEDLLPVPKFDPELLPAVFKNYVMDTSERIQCPPEFVAIGLLVVFSSIIGAGCAIRPHRVDDWSVIPNLWGAIIGIPSIKKSPALNAAMSPLATLEKEAEKQFKENKSTVEVNKQELELRKKVIRSEMERAVKEANGKELEFIKSKLVYLEKENGDIKCKRYKTNDTTVEKLQELLADNQRGLLQYNDELMGFLANLEKEGREGSRAFYLEAWNGWSKNQYQTDRIVRGSISCNPCISVLGGIQPSKLRIYLRNMLDNIGNDGFIQRFQLLVYPDTPKDWKLVDRAPDYIAISQIEEIATKIANTDFISLGAKIEGEFPLPVFRFQSDAQTFFHEWLEKLERRLIELGDGLIAQHLSKYRSLMPSLSLIFYLSRAVTSGISSGIALEDVERASRFCDYLESHARRVYSMIDKRGVFAAKVLLEKIRNGELVDGFTQRDASRPQWSGLSISADVKEACEELIERGYLKEEKVEPTSSGGRPTHKYRIHPEYH